MGKVKLGFKSLFPLTEFNEFQLLKSAVCSLCQLCTAEKSSRGISSLAPTNKQSLQTGLVFTGGEEPKVTLIWALVGQKPSSIPRPRLGAVLGAAGSLGAPAPYLLEAAEIPQPLSRLERHISLLTQMNTPACPLCPLSGDFRSAISQKLSLFFFLLHNSRLFSACFKTRGRGRKGWTDKDDKKEWG